MIKKLFLIVAILVLAFVITGGVCTEPSKPDLIVQSIDNIDVAPGPSGGFFTTVTFTIANIGAANAGPFKVSVMVEPAPDKKAATADVTGLAAGATKQLSVTQPTSSNCYDPDCTVCVMVDSAGDVGEPNEINNEKCETKEG